MLLNNENVDYLSEWPAHYYEIEDINERERILQLAIEQKLDPALDEKRLLILRKRFGDHPAEKRADLFLRAWMMIQAASAGGVSFFQKKRQKNQCGPRLLLHYNYQHRQHYQADNLEQITQIMHGKTIRTHITRQSQRCCSLGKFGRLKIDTSSQPYPGMRTFDITSYKYGSYQ